jgi:hypothetical protein
MKLTRGFVLFCWGCGPDPSAAGTEGGRQKRIFERHPGTGRPKNEFKRRGGGQNNWGRVEDTNVDPLLGGPVAPPKVELSPPNREEKTQRAGGDSSEATGTTEGAPSTNTTTTTVTTGTNETKPSTECQNATSSNTNATNAIGTTTTTATSGTEDDPDKKLKTLDDYLKEEQQQKQELQRKLKEFGAQPKNPRRPVNEGDWKDYQPLTKKDEDDDIPLFKAESGPTKEKDSTTAKSPKASNPSQSKRKEKVIPVSELNFTVADDENRTRGNESGRRGRGRGRGGGRGGAAGNNNSNSTNTRGRGGGRGRAEIRVTGNDNGSSSIGEFQDHLNSLSLADF